MMIYSFTFGFTWLLWQYYLTPKASHLWLLSAILCIEARNQRLCISISNKKVIRAEFPSKLWPYSTFPISRGQFSPNNSRKIATARPSGQGMTVFPEFKAWPKFVAFEVLYYVLYRAIVYRDTSRVYSNSSRYMLWCCNLQMYINSVHWLIFLRKEENILNLWYMPWEIYISEYVLINIFDLEKKLKWIIASSIHFSHQQAMAVIKIIYYANLHKNFATNCCVLYRCFNSLVFLGLVYLDQPQAKVYGCRRARIYTTLLLHQSVIMLVLSKPITT